VRTTSENIESELADHYHITWMYGIRHQPTWRTEYYTITTTGVNGKYKMAYKNEHLKRFEMMCGGLEA
jgi:hypothetical protein